MFKTIVVITVIVAVIFYWLRADDCALLGEVDACIHQY